MRPRLKNRAPELIARPRWGLWKLAGPMMAGMSIHTIYMIVDFAFIGTINDQAVAGVTLVGPLFFMVIALLNALGTTFTALIAQALGRGDEEEASRVASGSLGFVVLLGVLFAGAGLLVGSRLLWLAGAKGVVHDDAWAYFQVIAATVPLFFFSGALRSVLVGEGDTTTPVVIMGISSVVNLGLDGLFIQGFGWGTRGAALATASAQVFSLTLFSVRLLVQRRSVVRFRLSYIVPHRGLFRGLLVIGLPMAAGQLIMAAGAGLNNRLLSEFGTAAVAGYGAASRVDMIVAMPIFGLAGAAVTLIGMFAGAGRADLIRSTALYTYRWGLTIAVGVGGAAYLASVPIMRLFVDDPAAVALGRLYLGFMLFIYPLMAFGATTGRILQGLGYGLPSLVITGVRILGVGVPGAYVAVYGFGAPVQAVWIAMLVGGIVSNLISFLWVRKVIWRGDPTERARRGAQRGEVEAEAVVLSGAMASAE